MGKLNSFKHYSLIHSVRILIYFLSFFFFFTFRVTGLLCSVFWFWSSRSVSELILLCCSSTRSIDLRIDRTLYHGSSVVTLFLVQFWLFSFAGSTALLVRREWPTFSFSSRESVTVSLSQSEFISENTNIGPRHFSATENISDRSKVPPASGSHRSSSFQFSGTLFSHPGNSGLRWSFCRRSWLTLKQPRLTLSTLRFSWDSVESLYGLFHEFTYCGLKLKISIDEIH